MPTIPATAPRSVGQAWGVRPATNYTGPVSNGTYRVGIGTPTRARPDYSSYSGGTSGRWGSLPGASKPAQQLAGPPTGHLTQPTLPQAPSPTIKTTGPAAGARPANATFKSGAAALAADSAFRLFNGQGPVEAMLGSVGSAVGATAGTVADGVAGAAYFGSLGRINVEPGSLEQKGAEYGDQIGRSIGRLLQNPFDRNRNAGRFPVRDNPGGTFEEKGDPPWTGGQMPGVTYRVTARVVYSGHPDGEPDRTEGPATQLMEGPLRKRSLGDPELGSVGEEVYESGPFGRSFSGVSQVYSQVQVVVQNVERVDGQPDTGGNPPAPNVSVPYPSGTRPPVWDSTPAAAPVLAGAAAAGALGGAALASRPSQRNQAPPSALTGAGPKTATAPARPKSPPRTPSKPPVANPPGPKPNRRRTIRRSRSNNKCGCNKGILSALKSGRALPFGEASSAAQFAALFSKLNAMQNFAETAWKATRADKIINLLTLITTLHNASMISRDIGETLGYVLSNALAVVGIKDENDSPLDVNQLVGESVENFIKGIVGEDVYTDVRTSWQKANRVLQSASNIVWTIRNIHDTTSDILEWTAENTGKIGNALKRYGVVGERSYPWMAERVSVQDAYRTKLSRVFEGLENIEDTADSLAVVTSNVREIQEEVNELGQARDRFKQAVEDLAPDATPTAAPENIPVATAAATADQASQSPEVSITDADRRDPDATP